jgi:hypothetical protein
MSGTEGGPQGQSGRLHPDHFMPSTEPLAMRFTRAQASGGPDPPLLPTGCMIAY